jgi:hypothetical protein
MNIYKHIGSRVIWLVMVSTVDADELPAKYSAFKKCLGEWSGTAEYEMITPKGSEKVRAHKSSKCYFDQNRDVIVMSDSEVVPMTKVKAEASGEIRWDESSKRFKMIHWGKSGDVRLFVVEQRGESLLFRQVDSLPGENLESEVFLNDKGKLVEKGRMSLSDPGKTAVVWNLIYEKSEKQPIDKP